ncbi:MAG: DUF2304 family protein [Candidatus Berkelbacteria bacterium]
MDLFDRFLTLVTPIRVILSLFAVFAWTRVVLRFKDKVANAKELGFWSLVWLGFIIIIFIPYKTTFVAHLLGMERGFDAMALIAIVALFYAVYRLYIKMNEAEREITKLVRQVALKLDVINGEKDKTDLK